jgi:flagellar FliL protein
MNKKLVLIVAAVLLVGAGAAGGAVWFMKGKAAEPAKAAAEEKKSGEPLKYLTIEKVIVMMRRQPGDTVPHYMSADLVISTTAKQEKEAKEALPMLRSVAVRALSALPMEKASMMTIDQFVEELNKAYDEAYTKEARERPFEQVMIGKLILE